MKRKVLIIIFVLLGVALAVIGANYAIYVMRVQDAQQKLKNDFALLDKIEEMKDPLERQQEVARNFVKEPAKFTDKPKKILAPT